MALVVLCATTVLYTPGDLVGASLCPYAAPATVPASRGPEHIRGEVCHHGDGFGNDMGTWDDHVSCSQEGAQYMSRSLTCGSASHPGTFHSFSLTASCQDGEELPMQKMTNDLNY